LKFKKILLKSQKCEASIVSFYEFSFLISKFYFIFLLF